MKLDNQNIDKQIADKLKNNFAEFDNAAWLHMEKLLEKEYNKKIILIPLLNKKKGIIMSILALLSTAAVFVHSFLSPNSNSTKAVITTAKTTTTATSSAKPAATLATRQTQNSASITATNASLAKQKIVAKPKNLTLAVNLENISGQKPVTHINTASTAIESKVTNTAPVLTSAMESATQPIDSSKKRVKQIINPKTKYESATYSYDCKYERNKPISDGWMGMYYNTMQKNTQSWDSFNSGFSFQFMSNNLKNWKHVGVYAGGEWGMLFYGKTANNQVAINTTNQDSGFTYLRSNSMDFLFKVHMELNNNKFIAPYINLSAGPRLIYANQTVRSYTNLKDYESSSNHNVAFNASMMAGVGIGARLFLLPHVSLDARYEYLIGSKTSQVDLQKSNYNGLNYNVVKNTFKPENGYLRIGLLIDFDGESCTRTVTKEARTYTTYDTTTIVEYGDTSIIKIECECPCNKQNNNSQVKPPQENNEQLIRRPSNGSSHKENTTPNRPTPTSKPSGGGKKPFPGTTKPTPPVIRH